MAETSIQTADTSSHSEKRNLSEFKNRFTTSVRVQTILQDLGVLPDISLETQRDNRERLRLEAALSDLAEFLAPHMFDRGLQKVIDPEELKTVLGEKLDYHVHRYHDVIETMAKYGGEVYCLSRPMLQWLTGEMGYVEGTHFDVRKVFNANGISPLVGDILLKRFVAETKDVCERVRNEDKENIPPEKRHMPGFFVIRKGGDEFDVVALKELASSIDKVNERVVNTFQETQGLYYVGKNEGGVFVQAPNGVAVKDESPSAKEYKPDTTKTLKQRVDLLIKYNPNLRSIFDNLWLDKGKENNFFSPEQKLKLVSLIESLTQHPLMADKEEKLKQEHNLSSLHFFPDLDSLTDYFPNEINLSLDEMTDLRQVAKDLRPKQEVVMVHISWVAAIKPINGNPHLGYKGGDAFIENQAPHILAIASSLGIKDVNILLRGSDFTFILENPSPELVDEFQKRLVAEYSKKEYVANYVDGTEGQMYVPLVPVVTAEPFTLHIFTNPELRFQNKLEVFKAMNNLGSRTGEQGLRSVLGLFHETIKHVQEEGIRESGKPISDFNKEDMNVMQQAFGPEKSADFWNYFALYLSPHDKRGILRLTSLAYFKDVPRSQEQVDEIIKKLGEVYEQYKVKGETEYRLSTDPEKFAQFIKIVSPILEYQETHTMINATPIKGELYTPQEEQVPVEVA